MGNQLPGSELDPIICGVCHREIPHAEALNIEGQEYTYFFCGYGCFDHWRQSVEEGDEEHRKSDNRGANNP